MNHVILRLQPNGWARVTCALCDRRHCLYSYVSRHPWREKLHNCVCGNYINCTWK